MEITTRVYEVNLSLLIFFCLYWSVGTLLTLYVNFFNLRKVYDVKEVTINVMRNMIISFILLNIIFINEITYFDYLHPCIKFLVCLLFTEIWFYHVHIMLHQPQLYKLFHKQHHKFTKPYALTALYCSLYEFIVCNLVTASIGPLIMNLNGIWLYTWITIITLNLVISHSGVGYSEAHDRHHNLFKCEYGIFSIFDNLYNTTF